jgi:hypothetical protein
MLPILYVMRTWYVLSHINTHVHIYTSFDVFSAHAICMYVYMLFDGRIYGVFHKGTPHVVHKPFHVGYFPPAPPAAHRPVAQRPQDDACHRLGLTQTAVLLTITNVHSHEKHRSCDHRKTLKMTRNCMCRIYIQIGINMYITSPSTSTSKGWLQK